MLIWIHSFNVSDTSVDSKFAQLFFLFSMVLIIKF